MQDEFDPADLTREGEVLVVSAATQEESHATLALFFKRSLKRAPLFCVAKGVKERLQLKVFGMSLRALVDPAALSTVHRANGFLDDCLRLIAEVSQRVRMGRPRPGCHRAIQREPPDSLSSLLVDRMYGCVWIDHASAFLSISSCATII